MNDKSHVLVVDDEKLIGWSITQILTRNGYHTSWAKSGEVALQMVTENLPDLFIVDIKMDGIDGFEFCRRTRNRKDNTYAPILLLTSLDSTENKEKGWKVGADDFLGKPFDHTELLVRVKSLLRIKEYHDKLLKDYGKVTKEKNKLSELEKMKEELTHMIIHDMNSPLATIAISLETILLGKEKLPEKQVVKLNDCLTRCNDLTRFIENILDINKMEETELKLEKELTSLIQLSDDTLSQLKQKIEAKQIALSFIKQKNIPPVNIDKILMKRVISNLLDNAIHHTPSGTKVEVGIDYNADNKMVFFSVKDNGDGLAPEYHQKIFDKFEQVNIKTEGALTGKSGLGLAFCKLAVEAHHGQIWVESEGKGKGSTFTFTIPLETTS